MDGASQMAVGRLFHSVIDLGQKEHLLLSFFTVEWSKKMVEIHSISVFV